MKIKLWGVRGSIPTTNPNMNKFGGNTSCIEVDADDWLLVLDAGSGIQGLNSSMSLKKDRIDILLTHLHIDHIQGLGFFAPLFNPHTEVHIWGPASTSQSLRARLGRYFSPPLFPVYFRNLICKLFLHEIEHSTFTIGPFTIQSDYVIHPGPTVGFRIQHNKSIFTYIPDHEPSLGCGSILQNVKWLSGSELVKDADLLMHDAQYTAEEYENRIGWGHSSMADAIQFASLCGAKKLLLMHHDPMHTDEQLENMYADLKQNIQSAIQFNMAREGDDFEI